MQENTSMAQLPSTYPTPVHEAAAEAVVVYFQPILETEAILLVNTCARGRATRNSSLDFIVCVAPEALAMASQRFKDEWLAFCRTDRRFAELRQVGRFAEVHLDIVDGRYAPRVRTIDDGADGFELVVGNHLAYSVILWERSDYARQLRRQWLPYYGESLRQARLVQVQNAFHYHLDHVALYAERELYFAAFDRLYTSFQLFLQALFIARRTYPLAYNKWIREQIEDILGLPELYRLLPGLLEIRPFESGVVAGRAEELRILFTLYAENSEVISAVRNLSAHL